MNGSRFIQFRSTVMLSSSKLGSNDDRLFVPIGETKEERFDELLDDVCCKIGVMSGLVGGEVESWLGSALDARFSELNDSWLQSKTAILLSSE